MKRMRCWSWTAALWLAAGSLLMGGCGADENPAQEGTGGAGQMIEADTAVSQEETEIRQNMEEAAISFPWVMVVSGEEMFIPVEHINYTESTVVDDEGNEQTVSDYSGYFQPEDITGMPRVPYQPGIAIRTEKTPISCAYERFAVDGTSLGERTTVEGTADIVLPEPAEDYLVELRFSFGGEGNFAGYQYFFRVTAQSPTPILKITSETGPEKTEMTASKGAGAFPALTMEENICYLPLGSRLNLSFSEDIPLKEITMYEMGLTDSRENFLDRAEDLKGGTVLQSESPSFELGTNIAAAKRGFLFECCFADGREEIYSAAIQTDEAPGQGTDKEWRTDETDSAAGQIPQIPEQMTEFAGLPESMDYEDVTAGLAKMPEGEEDVFAGSPGKFYTVRTEKFEYFYFQYEGREELERTNYAVVGEDVKLNCGIHVGMTADEAGNIIPGLYRMSFREEEAYEWNTNSYPDGWCEQFAAVLIAEVLYGGPMPKYAGFMLDDQDVIRAITFEFPTAG